MRFEKPEVVNSINQAILLAAVALAKIQYQDPLTAAEGLPKIWAKVKGEIENNPEHRAWTFIASCVSTAGVMLLREPRMRCGLDDGELQSHAQQLVDRLPSNGDFRATDITNLALSQHTQNCIDHIPQFLTTAAPDAGLDGSQAKQAYRETLARSVTAVFERQSDLFFGMVEAVQGATSTADRRDVAWKRHGTWIRGLFYETPIFSPDSDIDIPLSSVYQRLRCYWNTEHSIEQPGEQALLKYRTASIAELHETIDLWLETPRTQDMVRLIAGGPGSGKSSFARAYSAERINKNTHRVLFIQLQHLTVQGTLRESIGRHLEGRHGYKWPNKTEGFPENPLDWHGEDTRPILLVFDGLDELTTNKDRESDLTKKFVSNLKHVLNELNASGQSASALVLGRDLAMDAAREDGDLGLEALIHVAPIRAMTRDDLRLNQNPPDKAIAEEFDPVDDPHNLMKRDSRIAYWKQWCSTQGSPDQDPSPAITDERMSELNVEPLLLHLLIVSEFCGDRWEEAANNRNLIYRDILQKVFKRNKKNELDAYKQLEEEHFFELMEVFGLAAFRGNGRTGNHEEFRHLRERYAKPTAERTLYSKIDGASLKNVALMVHSRHDLDGAGFEFVHKSFVEYLGARALLGAAERLHRLLRYKENEEKEEHLALRWVELIGGGQMSMSMLQFLKDECNLRGHETKTELIETLSILLDWTLTHGFPVQKSEDRRSLSYRALEQRQKCAETAMLVTVTALWASFDGDKKPGLLPIKKFARAGQAASDMIGRLFPLTEIGATIPATLGGLVLAESDLFMCRIPEANLNGADLSRANLSRAYLWKTSLSEANLSKADLSQAYLVGADLRMANLRGTDLSQANLSGAKLMGANLARAYLPQADLIDARLNDADLRIANLSEADLTSADLRNVNMTGAYLRMADLRKANFKGAKLSSANLIKAQLSFVNLTRADLTETELIKADLSWANLYGAQLDGADLSECRMGFASLRSVDCTNTLHLSQQQVNVAFGVKSGVGLTQLPSGLTYPDHWHIAEEAAEDDAKNDPAYLKAWQAFRSAMHAVTMAGA